jgi:hypothetical protein
MDIRKAFKNEKMKINKILNLMSKYKYCVKLHQIIQ